MQATCATAATSLAKWILRPLPKRKGSRSAPSKAPEKMRGAVKDEMFNYILSVDKSAYAEITNNEAVSKTILFNFQYNDVFRKIQTEDQVNRLENIYTDHLNIKDRRNQLLARVQAGEHLTPEENESHYPKVVFVNDKNEITEVVNYEKHGEIK